MANLRIDWHIGDDLVDTSADSARNETGNSKVASNSIANLTNGEVSACSQGADVVDVWNIDNVGRCNQALCANNESSDGGRDHIVLNQRDDKVDREDTATSGNLTDIVTSGGNSSDGS